MNYVYDSSFKIYTVLFLFHWDSHGLAAASILVLAFNWQIMPALAILKVCCSITSCNTDLALSFILSNSSMQHIPLSASPKAPVCNINCPVSGSFVT